MSGSAQALQAAGQRFDTFCARSSRRRDRGGKLGGIVGEEMEASRKSGVFSARARNSPAVDLRAFPGRKVAPTRRDKPKHHANHDDRGGDEKPERAAERLHGDLDPVAPGVGKQAGDGFNAPHRRAQPPCEDVRAVEETQPQQRQRQDGSAGPEEMNARPILHGGDPRIGILPVFRAIMCFGRQETKPIMPSYQRPTMAPSAASNTPAQR